MTDRFRPLKDAFGRFATGIGVACCADGPGNFTAITINSFTSVSLDPPLVLWCIESRATAFPDFMKADSYAVSILDAGQKNLSERFSGTGFTPLERGEVDITACGAPLLKERLAGFACSVNARHHAGDHVIMVGRVGYFDSRDGEPLVYFASRYHEGIGRS